MFSWWLYTINSNKISFSMGAFIRVDWLWSLRADYIILIDIIWRLWLCGILTFRGLYRLGLSFSWSCRPWTRACRGCSLDAARNSWICYRGIRPCSCLGPKGSNLWHTRPGYSQPHISGCSSIVLLCVLSFLWGLWVPSLIRHSSLHQWKRWLARITRLDTRGSCLNSSFCRYLADIHTLRTIDGSLLSSWATSYSLLHLE